MPMKEGLEIRRIGIKRIDNALHVTYHRSMYDYVVELELAKLGIPEELRVEWKDNIDFEQEINLETQASANSDKLHQKDEERGRLLQFIFGEIRNYTFAPDADMVEAAKRLAIVANQYAGIRRESFDRETAHIEGLIKDLKKTEYAADVAKLNLTAAVTKLETLNK